MSRSVPFVPKEYYHIYNRGVNKMTIFNDILDYDRFQKLLYIVNSKETGKFSNIIKSKKFLFDQERGETLIDIGAYCLMPNHFHLLVKIKNQKDAAIFLQRLQLSYSKYFNVKNKRSGVLFQGKSKSRHIIQNNDLKYNFSYIHLNPVKLIQKNWKDDGIKDIKKTIKYLSSYKYSSYLDFVESKRPELNILNRSVFPNYFSSSKLFKKELLEWLNYDKN